MMTEQCYVPPNLNSGSPVFGPFSQREMIIFTAFALGGMLIAQTGSRDSGAFALILISAGAAFILIRHFVPSATKYFMHCRRNARRIGYKHDFLFNSNSEPHSNCGVLSFKLREINFASAGARQKEVFLSSFIELCCTANSSSKFISLAVQDSLHSMERGRKDCGGCNKLGFQEYRSRNHYAVLSNESQAYLLRALSNEISIDGMPSDEYVDSRSESGISKKMGWLNWHG